MSGGYVDLDFFGKLDLRVCRALKVEPIPGRSKLYKVTVDLGDLGRRVIVAGGAEHYKPSDLEGKLLIALVNLKPKVIGGVESMGMLLAADVDGKPVWLTVISEAPPGAKVR
jgi:methionine--tRNA ligase beta chain